MSVIPFTNQIIPPSIARTDQDGTNNANLTTWTYLGKSIGSVYPGRRIFVACSWEDGNSREPSTCSIGGVAATRHMSTGSSQSGSAIFSALVPNGTTADIEIVMTGNTDDLMFAVYRAIDLIGTSPSDAQFVNGVLSLSINYPSQGIILGSTNFPTGSSGDFTGLTTDYDASQSNLTLETGLLSNAAGNAAYGISYSTGTRGLGAVSWR